MRGRDLERTTRAAVLAPRRGTAHAATIALRREERRARALMLGPREA
jgi:hypothetical protein